MRNVSGLWLRPRDAEKFHFVLAAQVITDKENMHTLCMRSVRPHDCTEGFPQKKEKCGTCYQYQLRIRQSWLDNSTITELRQNREARLQRKEASR